MNNKGFSYLISLFFFKLAVGAILLATSWDSLSLSGNPILNVSLIMALSFFPAAFARPLFNKLSFIDLEKLLTVNFWLAAILIFIEYLLLKEKTSFAFLVNFILWIIIFTIEVSLEKWYVTLAQNIKLGNVRRLSGISISTAQLGVILGPVLVIFSRAHHDSLTYIIIAITFLIASSTPFSMTRIKKAQNKTSPTNSNVNQTDSKEKRGLYTFAFALIWPTLAIFNISAPVLANTQYHSIKVAGGMEVLIGLAMAISGFLHPLVTKTLSHIKRLFIVFLILTISAITIYFYSDALSIVFLSVFLIGLTLGYLRVELRTFLSRRFIPKTAGEIVAAANSWSGPLVLIYCLTYYMTSNIKLGNALSPIFSISFIFASFVFCYLLISDQKLEKEK